jgi:hypothetical protein
MTVKNVSQVILQSIYIMINIKELFSKSFIQILEIERQMNRKYIKY